tara:strand:- start:1025 stop:1300 length:276 start_codon:yes stop_codon:yes gene_type:complete
MGAIPYIGYGDPMLGKLLTHPFSQYSKLLLGVIPSPDSGLVSDNNNGVTFIHYTFTGLKNTRYKLKTLGLTYIAVININYAIPVEKKRFAR